MTGAAIWTAPMIEIDGAGTRDRVRAWFGRDLQFVPGAARVGLLPAFVASGPDLPGSGRSQRTLSMPLIDRPGFVDTIAEIIRKNLWRRARSYRRPLDGHAGLSAIGGSRSPDRICQEPDVVWSRSSIPRTPLRQRSEGSRPRLRASDGMIGIRRHGGDRRNLASSSSQAANPLARAAHPREPHAPRCRRLRPDLRGARERGQGLQT